MSPVVIQSRREVYLNTHRKTSHTCMCDFTCAWTCNLFFLGISLRHTWSNEVELTQSTLTHITAEFYNWSGFAYNSHSSALHLVYALNIFLSFFNKPRFNLKNVDIYIEYLWGTHIGVLQDTRHQQMNHALTPSPSQVVSSPEFHTMSLVWNTYCTLTWVYMYRQFPHGPH